MSFGFGIQFGLPYKVGLCLEKISLGADVDSIPVMDCRSSYGLLVQPIIGYLSDNTLDPVLVEETLLLIPF
jgi:hypothetical protein